jgi:hypothetical protein
MKSTGSILQVQCVERTWFSLTTNVFVAFLFQIRNAVGLQHYSFIALEIPSLVQCYLECLIRQATAFLQQEITEVFDEAARKFVDETLEDERNDSRVTIVMRATTKSKAQSLQGSILKVYCYCKSKTWKSVPSGGQSNLPMWSLEFI